MAESAKKRGFLDRLFFQDPRPKEPHAKKATGQPDASVPPPAPPPPAFCTGCGTKFGEGNLFCITCGGKRP